MGSGPATCRINDNTGLGCLDNGNTQANAGGNQKLQIATAGVPLRVMAAIERTTVAGTLPSAKPQPTPTAVETTPPVAAPPSTQPAKHEPATTQQIEALARAVGADGLGDRVRALDDSRWKTITDSALFKRYATPGTTREAFAANLDRLSSVPTIMVENYLRPSAPLAGSSSTGLTSNEAQQALALIASL